ncbi:MAG: cytochrome b [Pseudomonadota bacterium]
MAARSTDERYGRVAVILHWLSAALIIGLMMAGYRAADAVDAQAKAAILRLHVPIGILVLVLTLARIGWWLAADRTRPGAPPGTPHVQALVARVVHRLLLLGVVLAGLSGIALMVLSGAGAVLFDGAPGPLPEFWDYPPRWVHWAMGQLLSLLLLVHIAAALYHHFWRRDRIFARMGFGR